MALACGQVIVIAGITLNVVFGRHVLGSDGFLSWSRGVGIIVSRGPKSIPTALLSEIEQCVEAEKCLVVDARWRGDYEAGHLPGAVNLTIGASDNEIRQAMGGRPPETTVIVYCSNRSCPMADQVAVYFQRLEYPNVFVFRGGWEEWSRYVQPNRAGG